MIDSDSVLAMLHSPPPCKRERSTPTILLSKINPRAAVLRTLQNHKVAPEKKAFLKWLLELTPETVLSCCQSVLAHGGFSPQSIDWMLKWVTQESNEDLIFCCSLVLTTLAFPEELIPNLRDRLFYSGAIQVILPLSVKQQLSFCNSVSQQEFVFEDKLGSGAGGAVFRAIWTTQGNMPVAVKCFRQYDVWWSTKEEFLMEVGLMSVFGCFKHFVPCLGADVRNGLLVMPLLQLGSLESLIQNDTLPQLSWDRKLRMAWMISRAMRTLHQYGILHRDLKPANILVDHNYNCYLTDFGISRVARNQNSSSGRRKRSKTLNVGTGPYMAPEVETGYYDESIDVYSFGVLLWQLVSDCPQSVIPCDLRASTGRRLEIPDHSPEFFTEMIKSCWHQNPKMRPSFRQLTKELRKYFEDIQ